jgi:hypothetical protein
MGAFAGIILRTVLQVAAGVGLADLLDRFVKPQVPAQYYPEPVSPGFKPFKIIWLAVAFAAGFMLLKWLGRILKIRIIK